MLVQVPLRTSRPPLLASSGAGVGPVGAVDAEPAPADVVVDGALIDQRRLILAAVVADRAVLALDGDARADRERARVAVAAGGVDLVVWPMPPPKTTEPVPPRVWAPTKLSSAGGRAAGVAQVDGAVEGQAAGDGDLGTRWWPGRACRRG